MLSPRSLDPGCTMHRRTRSTTPLTGHDVDWLEPDSTSLSLSHDSRNGSRTREIGKVTPEQCPHRKAVNYGTRRANDSMSSVMAVRAIYPNSEHERTSTTWYVSFFTPTHSHSSPANPTIDDEGPEHGTSYELKNPETAILPTNVGWRRNEHGRMQPKGKRIAPQPHPPPTVRTLLQYNNGT